MKKSILKVFGFAVLTALCANVWADEAGLPKAIVTEITDSADLAKYKARVINIEGIEQVDNIPSGDCVFELTPNRAWKFECDSEEKDNAYLDWYADYTVSFDKPVAKNSMGLFGYYGEWLGIGFFAPLEIPADYKVPLLNFMTKKSNWTYSQIRSLVGTFVCGAFNLSTANADTTMTVELRLFRPDMSPDDIRDSSRWSEGVNTHVVESIAYKLSDVMNVPAKKDAWPELVFSGTANRNASIPAENYALDGNSFVKLVQPKAVGDQATAYFQPREIKPEEVKVEADPEVEKKTKATDEEGKEIDIPTEKKTEVTEKVQAAVNDIVTNRSAQEKTDTGVTAEEILTVKTADDETVLKESIKTGIQESQAYKDASEPVKAAVDEALTSKDVSSKINIKLEATGVTIEATEQKEVTVTKAVFDVKPLATVTITTQTQQGTEVSEFTTTIANSDLAGKTLTVRLPLPKSFTRNVRVVHESNGYPTEEFLVASQKGVNDERFCEVNVSHFSTMTAYYTDESIPKKYQAADVLGIIRRNDSGSSKASYENAIAVPWVSRAANGDLQQGMTVADFITSNGLGEGDELHIWIPNSKTTHQGTAGGVTVTRKGTYAIFRWDAAEQKWVGAKDMGGGDIAKIGTDYLIPRGAAVWYKRTSGTGDYTIVGLVSNACETVVEKGTKSGPVMTLLVNPFPADTINVAAIPGAEGDELILNPMGSSGATETYKYGNGSWGHTVSEAHETLPIIIQKFKAVKSIVVVPGRSFWYVSRGGQPTINWKSIKVEVEDDAN